MQGKQVLINDLIRDRQLRVIGADNTQIGILSREEALRQARALNLDLVIVSRNSQPPVARIVDWGKYVYQRDKNLQSQRRDNKSHDLKEMRFNLAIGNHDIDVKLRKVSQFLEKDAKVRLVISWRLREDGHKDTAFELAQTLVNKLNRPDNFAGAVVVEQNPRQTGGRKIVLVVRNSKVVSKDVKSQQAETTSGQQRPLPGHQDRKSRRPAVVPESQSEQKDRQPAS